MANASVQSVRSGDFVTGNLTVLKSESDTLTKKIYWLPQDPAIAKTARLKVTVSDPATPNEPTIPQRWGKELGKGWIPADGSQPVTTGTLAPGSTVYYFWPSGIRFPAHGRWQLTAEAPGHWGCYIVSV